jgi:agmatine deiminase
MGSSCIPVLERLTPPVLSCLCYPHTVDETHARMERYHPPAEWAPHEAVWVAWPSAEDLWKQDLVPAQRAFTAMCAAIADLDPETRRPRGERLELLVPDEERRRAAMRALEGLAPRVHTIPFGDIWLRDTAPIFLLDASGEARAACFAFNGWGGKYVLPNDDRVASRIAALSGARATISPYVLEGGSVESDGEGTLLTTRQCLLNPNRNPSMTQAAVEASLRDSLGAEKVLWLGDGLVNDHTDGHIDTVARFVAPGVVVCMEASDDDDPNARVLETLGRELEQMTDARGRRLTVVRVPSPGRVLGRDGAVLPASYVNFYIGNRTVVVPTYGSPHDEDAVESIARLFRTRLTVGIDARSMLSGGGAFHCITQQQPRATRESG